MAVVLETQLDFPLVVRGKVREVYDVGEGMLLLVVSDRVSAYDVVMAQGIPDKGAVLNQLAAYFFRQTADVAPNHFITNDVTQYPERLQCYADLLRGRSSLVKKAQPVDGEFIFRGYLFGSLWEAYQEGKTRMCDPALPQGLTECHRFPEPVFNVTTKASAGHDLPLTPEEARAQFGDLYDRIKEMGLRVFAKATSLAAEQGLILVDTKFEFGLDGDGQLMLIDEVCTPDSSRYWLADSYGPNKTPKALDKQFLRNYLDQIRWDRTPPPPDLPEEVVNTVAQKYRDVYGLVTGEALQI